MDRLLIATAVIVVALLSLVDGQYGKQGPGYRWRGQYCRVTQFGRSICDKSDQCPRYAPCTEVPRRLGLGISNNRENYVFYFCKPKVCDITVYAQNYARDSCPSGSECRTSGDSRFVKFCSSTSGERMPSRDDQFCFMEVERP